MRLRALALALTLGACAEEAPPPAAPDAGAALPAPLGEAAPAQGADAGALPSPDPARPAPEKGAPLRQPAAMAPEIYMDIARTRAGPVAITFATDASRDATPGDDPAVRITPADGACNAEELPAHAFDPAARPVFGPSDAARGVTARDLPAFMAVTVTDSMLARGLAASREDTRAENICTRKLWERLVAARSGQ